MACVMCAALHLTKSRPRTHDTSESEVANQLRCVSHTSIRVLLRTRRNAQWSVGARTTLWGNYSEAHTFWLCVRMLWPKCVCSCFDQLIQCVCVWVWVWVNWILSTHCAFNLIKHPLHLRIFWNTHSSYTYVLIRRVFECVKDGDDVGWC